MTKTQKRRSRRRPSSDESDDRRRASVACLECKKGHAKCGFERINGKCARCARLGLPCTVPAVRKKRGPMSKKEREELKKIIQPLAQEHLPLLRKINDQMKQDEEGPALPGMVPPSIVMDIGEEHSDEGEYEERAEKDKIQPMKSQSNEASQLLDRLSKEYARFRERCVPLKEWQQQQHRLKQKKESCPYRKAKSTQIMYAEEEDDEAGNDEMVKILDEMANIVATDPQYQCEAPGGVCKCQLEEQKHQQSLSLALASMPPIIAETSTNTTTTVWNKNPSEIVDIEDLTVGLFGCENCTCMHNINNTCDLFVGQHAFVGEGRRGGDGGRAKPDPLFGEGMARPDSLTNLLDMIPSNTNSNDDIGGENCSCNANRIDGPLEGLESMLLQTIQQQGHTETPQTPAPSLIQVHVQSEKPEQQYIAEGDLLHILLDLTPIAHGHLHPKQQPQPHSPPHQEEAHQAYHQHTGVQWTFAHSHGRSSNVA